MSVAVFSPTSVEVFKMKSAANPGSGEVSDLMLSSNDFCAVFVHEMANPLNGMFVTLQIMERRLQGKPGCLDQTIVDLLRNLRGEIERLMSLLAQLRSLRIFSPPEVGPISLASEVADLLALEQAQYAQHGIRVEQKIAADLPAVMADHAKLRQVLLNLCKNAVEAMPNGGTLTLRGYKAETEICLEIADTGEGIPEDTQLFQPFATTKPGGTGLGLAIALEIVRQHNGTLSYSSQPGKGTVFCIRLPPATHV
jgi:signal transduction histidine kinase